MRKAALSAIILLGTFGVAHAADPTGEWLVEDKVATVKIADCGGHLWGVIASEKKPGGIDSKNPDKSKRNRPTLGMPILLDMTPDPDENDKWSGHIYNAKNGKTYEASIEPVSATELKVEGCVLGFLCGGQTWTRVAETPPPVVSGTAKPHEKPRVTGMAPKSTGRTIGQKDAAAAGESPAVSDICMLPDVTGASH